MAEEVYDVGEAIVTVYPAEYDEGIHRVVIVKDGRTVWDGYEETEGGYIVPEDAAHDALIGAARKKIVSYDAVRRMSQISRRLYEARKKAESTAKGYKLDDNLDGIVRVHGLTFEEWAEDAGVEPATLRDPEKRKRLLSMWLRAEDPAEFSFEEDEALVIPAWIRRS